MNEDIKTMYAPVLIVEDEEDHARLIIKALKGSGKLINEIIHINNGEDAMNYFQKTGKYVDNIQQIPALILLDIKMPMKNGFEVLAELKADEKLREIPVVVLTTTSTSEDIAKALQIGANDFIVKPIKFNDFLDKVGKIGYYWGMVSDTKLLFS
jgi:two-component system response regulator